MLSRRSFLSIAAAPLAVPSMAANWPQFRGPDSTGVPATEVGLPETWSTTENVAWKAAIGGSGWSSPITWGDRIFLASARAASMTLTPEGGFYQGAVESPRPDDEHRWLAHCLDLGSGKELWQTELHRAVPKVGRHRKNSFASETCVTDGEHLYAHVGDLGTWCLDYDGKVLWSKEWPPVRTRWGYGTASSPALHGGRLYIANDSEDQSYLVALDKQTGQEIWRVDREEGTGWSTPFIWENGERTEIISMSREKLRSYDLDGKLLWELKRLSTLAIPTPFSSGGLLYVTSGYMSSQDRPIYAIRPGASGDITLPEGVTSNEYIVWSVPQGGPYHPSGLVYRGHYYTLFDRGFLTCHDAQTGEEVYGKQRVSRDSMNFTASPWAYNGKLFCLDEAGTTFVVQAGPEFKLLGANELGEMCMATPAIVDSGLLIRTYSTLYKIAS